MAIEYGGYGVEVMDVTLDTDPSVKTDIKVSHQGTILVDVLGSYWHETVRQKEGHWSTEEIQITKVVVHGHGQVSLDELSRLVPGAEDLINDEIRREYDRGICLL